MVMFSISQGIHWLGFESLSGPVDAQPHGNLETFSGHGIAYLSYVFEHTLGLMVRHRVGLKASPIDTL